MRTGKNWNILKRGLKWTIGIMAAAVICICVNVGMKGYDMYRDAISQISLKDKVEQIRSKENYTEFAELPETYVDPIAITRAVINDIRAGAFVEGGSTITQQLAKNLYFTQEKKMERKAAEVFMAFALEKEYSKNEILELYVNTIYFGNGYYCIKDASEGYFGKAPEDMDDYESTLLAGVPNAPSKYAPTVNPALAAKRQEQVLERLVECGLFTEKRARETMAETREYQEPDAA